MTKAGDGYKRHRQNNPGGERGRHPDHEVEAGADREEEHDDGDPAEGDHPLDHSHVIDGTRHEVAGPVSVEESRPLVLDMIEESSAQVVGDADRDATQESTRPHIDAESDGDDAQDPHRRPQHVRRSVGLDEAVNGLSA